MSDLLKPLQNSHNDEIGCYVFYCPGCDEHHPYEVPRWQFNGDMASPTFSPSLLVDKDNPEKRCHLFVRDGQIEYCSDCHHELAGKTIPMVPHQW